MFSKGHVDGDTLAFSPILSAACICAEYILYVLMCIC